MDFKLLIECEGGVINLDMQGRENYLMKGLNEMMKRKPELYALLTASVVYYALEHEIDLLALMQEGKRAKHKGLILPYNGLGN